MKRIVSLIASATEIVDALGAFELLHPGAGGDDAPPQAWQAL